MKIHQAAITIHATEGSTISSTVRTEDNTPDNAVRSIDRLICNQPTPATGHPPYIPHTLLSRQGTAPTTWNPIGILNMPRVRNLNHRCFLDQHVNERPNPSILIPFSAVTDIKTFSRFSIATYVANYVGKHTKHSDTDTYRVTRYVSKYITKPMPKPTHCQPENKIYITFYLAQEKFYITPSPFFHTSTVQMQKRPHSTNAKTLRNNDIAINNVEQATLLNFDEHETTTT